MPDNISALYGALKKNDFQVPENEDDFRKAIQNPKIVNELHSALKQNDFQVPESVNDFSSWLNPTQQEVKKKEEATFSGQGAYVRPLSQGGGEPAQSFSEATLGRLSDEQYAARTQQQINRENAIQAEAARKRKEQFYANVKPISQSTTEDIDLFAFNNSLPSTGEIYQTLKNIEINKAKGFQYKPKPIAQPLPSDVTKTTITPRLTSIISEEERNRQLALKAKEKEEEASITEIKEEATPLQKTLTLASNVAKGAIGVGRDFAQVGDLLIRKGIENTFEGEPKKYKPEVQGIIDRVRGYNLQRGDEAFEKDLGQYFYEHPEYKTSDAAQTARGLGQVIPSVVVGLLTGGTGAFAQTAIQGTLSGTQIFNEAYKRAKEYGTDDETAIKTAFLDAVGESYIDAFPTLKILNRFNKTVGGGFWNKAKQSAKETGIAFVEGGTSEGLQKIVSNAIASYNYDENVALLDDVFEEGKIGGFTQSLLSLGLSAIKHARVKAKTPEQKAELDKKEASLYDVIKNKNVVSPPMEGEAQPPAKSGTPPTMPVDEAITAVKEEVVTPQGEVAPTEQVTPQGEVTPLGTQLLPEVQAKVDEVKSERAKILAGLDTDNNGQVIMTQEAQTKLADLKNQELKIQEDDSQNKQRVSGEVGIGGKPIETQPIGEGSQKAVGDGGVFQAPTQVIPINVSGHVEQVESNPTKNNIQALADNAPELANEVIRQGNIDATMPETKAELPAAPTIEQQLKDIQEGNIVSFNYENESQVPEAFKDKISSRGENNGKPFVKVTVAKSLADYELNRAKEVVTEVKPKGEVTFVEKGEAKVEPEPTPQSEVEATAKALEGKKKSLDEKAKKLGYYGIKQFNAQNQLNENLSNEEKALLQEYSDFQLEVKNLKDEKVIAKLSDAEFSTWSKANDITRDDLGKVIKDDEIELAAKRIRILNERSDTKNADAELKKLKESKKKDNWTVESWKERFNEDIEQSEIDDINDSNREFNQALDKAVEELLGKPTESKPTEPTTEQVEATAKALEGKIKKEPDVKRDGDDLILKHGTAHNFTMFQLEKIGTGEGAQAFGYGLYFTDGSKIAEQYAKKLSDDKTGLVYEVRIKDGAKKEWAEWREPLEQDLEDKLYNSLTNEERAKYEKYLDNSNWDNDHVGKFDELKRDEFGIETYDMPSAVGLIYMDLRDAFGQEKATEIFKRAGIDGIKYRSNAGRGDNFNYVVFDPNSIEIIKKEKPFLSGKPKKISEAYHKAKADGSNPELVKAVEELLGKTPEKVSGGLKFFKKKPKSNLITTESIVLDVEKIKAEKLNAFEFLKKYKGYENFSTKDVRNALAIAYSKMMNYKAGAENLYNQISELEDILEDAEQVRKTTKEDFKKQAKESGDFSKKQLEIFNALVDSLQTEFMPEYDSFESSLAFVGIDSKRHTNFYALSDNILSSKDPSAFIHEIGHFAFYNILSKEDRLKYLKYMIDSSYGKEGKSLKERLAMTSEKVTTNIDGKEMEFSTNVGDNFSEYFAEQFRQWYLNERATPKEFDSIFEKVAEYLSNLINKLKTGEYIDKNLIEFFEKISPSKREKVSGGLTPQEEKLAENLKISKDDARKAKQASPKRTRKSKDIAEVIESETKIAEDSKNATKAEELIETIEIAEKSILENQEVDESFEQKYGVSEIALVQEIKDMGKQGDFAVAYKNLTGKDADLQVEIDFLAIVSAQGIKIRPKLAPIFTVENHTVQTKKLSKKPSKKKGLDSLDAIVSKDDLRPILKTVYFDGDNMVAMDGHKLIIIARQESDADIIEKLIEANYAKIKKTIPTYTKEQASAYIKEQLKDGLQGKSLNFQDGIVEQGKYPDYKQIIPTKYPNVAKIAAQELIDILNGAKAVKDNLSNNIFAINFLVENNNVYFNPTFLLETVSALQENGAKTIELFHNGDPSKLILLKSDNGNEGVVSPIMAKDKNPTTQEIDIAKPVQIEVKPSEVTTKKVEETKPSEVAKEVTKPTEAPTTKVETLEDKKAKAGESLQNLIAKAGLQKNIVPNEKSDTWQDIKNIVDYIASATGKKGADLYEAIKKYLKDNGAESVMPQIEAYKDNIIAETEQTDTQKIVELYQTNDTASKRKITEILNKEGNEKLKVIYNNIKSINTQLEKAGLLIKKGDCP